MKNLMKNVAMKCSDMKFRAEMTAIALMVGCPMVTFADGSDAAKDLASSVINTVFDIVTLVMGLSAVFILIPGIQHLIESNQSGSPEQKSNGIKGIVTGLALAAAAVLVQSTLKGYATTFLSGMGV